MSRAALMAWLMLALSAGASYAQIQPEIGSAGQAETPPPKTDISLGEAAILGIVEGLTEYLPVSSTGHLILASHAMDLTEYSDETGPFGRKLRENRGAAAFEIVIQLGAILAVLGLYRKRVMQMAYGLFGRDPAGRRLLVNLLIAFLPAAVIGLLIHRPIKEHLFGPITVAIALAVGGVLMIVIEQLYERRKWGRLSELEMITWRGALIVGFAQCLAMWPGVSRSMITIVAGLLVGMDMVTAAKFSFLLALPTLGGATLFEAIGSGEVLLQSAGWDGVLVGLMTSGVVAAVAVAVFIRWLTHHGLTPFGVYRLLLAGAVCWYFFG